MGDNNWTEWNGGECPVSKGVLVDVKLRNGVEFDNQYARSNDGTSWAEPAYWRHDGVPYDIIAYRLHQPEQVAWNGEGLPPVGTECEVAKHLHNAGTKVRVLCHDEGAAVCRVIDGDKLHDLCQLEAFEISPIRTEAERKRDEFTDACIDLDSSQDWSHSTDYFRGLYNAIAAGRIPGVKLL